MSTASPPGSPTGLWSLSARTSSRSSVRSGSVDPPRLAKDGYEWVWFPEGYWAERPVGRQESSKGLKSVPAGPALGKLFKWTRRPTRNSADLLLQAEQRDMSPMTTAPPSTSLKHLSQLSPTTSFPQSPYLSEQAHVQSLQHPMSQSITNRGDQDTWKSSPTPRRLSPLYAPITALISPGEKKAPHTPLVKSAWRPFRKPKEAEKPTEVSETQPPTGETVVSPSYFTQKTLRPPLPDAAGTGEDKAKSAPKGLCRWFGKSPWNRKGIQPPSRTSMVRASSLSLPDTRAGHSSRIPVPMPGSTISYPAGEALYVKFPSKKRATRNPQIGLTDVDDAMAIDDWESSSSGSTSTARLYSYGKEIDTQNGNLEWRGAPNKLVKSDHIQGLSFFEFDLPEHLPSSPMCPANPKHKLKGNGVCVFHGRGRQVSADAIPREWGDIGSQ